MLVHRDLPSSWCQSHGARNSSLLAVAAVPCPTRPSILDYSVVSWKVVPLRIDLTPRDVASGMTGARLTIRFRLQEAWPAEHRILDRLIGDRKTPTAGES
jgi:hypothetical protein